MGAYSTVGITMVILTVGGYFLGSLADDKLGTYPFLTILGLFIGIGAGFYELYQLAKKA